MRADKVIRLRAFVVVLGLVVALARAPAGSVLAASAAAPASLACIQDAFGGTKTFAGVSSLHIVADTKPAAGSHLLPGPRDISVVFPDRYKRIDEGQVPGGYGTLEGIVGFNGDTILSRPGQRDPEDTMRVARQEFVRQMLMRLPREFTGVNLASQVTRDAGEEQIALDASGPDDFRATLLADATTCMPVALQYKLGVQAWRIDLSAYREFDGIRFPTVLKTALDGQPWEEEEVSSVDVDASDAETYFASAR